MKRKLLLIMSFMATTMAFSQSDVLPEAITNYLEMFKDNGNSDDIKLSDADGKKATEFWGVDENSKKHFTIEFWYMGGANSGQQPFMNITGKVPRLVTAPKNGLFIYVNNSNRASAMVDYPGANIGNPILARDKWYHIAITYNAGELKLYVDGELMDNYLWNDKATIDGVSADDARATGITRPILDTSASAFEKADNEIIQSDATTGFWVVQSPNHDQKIADIRYWNKTLSGSTIKEWYNKYVTDKHPNYANLQHNWKMNEMYDLGDDKFSIPDRGKLGLTGIVNTEDIAKYPIFGEEDVTIISTGLATAKTLNASFTVNESSREITVTADKLDGTQKIIIFDAQGRAIYRAIETAHGGTLTVAAPQTAGLYFVRIGDGNNAFVGKVALKR